MGTFEQKAFSNGMLHVNLDETVLHCGDRLIWLEDGKVVIVLPASYLVNNK